MDSQQIRQRARYKSKRHENGCWMGVLWEKKVFEVFGFTSLDLLFSHTNRAVFHGARATSHAPVSLEENTSIGLPSHNRRTALVGTSFFCPFSQMEGSLVRCPSPQLPCSPYIRRFTANAFPLPPHTRGYISLLLDPRLGQLTLREEQLFSSVNRRKGRRCGEPARWVKLSQRLHAHSQSAN